MSSYRFDQTFEWNSEHGPSLSSEGAVAPAAMAYELFGRRLESPIGISAGLLPNSRWIEAYSKLKYSILTYKTVRSRERLAYTPPNWLFIDIDRPLEIDDDAPLVALPTPPRPPERLTSAVSFGMPSPDPSIWREDVRRAKDAISPGQTLIVSVVGTPQEPLNLDALADDYALCARWAAEAGADAVEANISCPNVCTAEGEIYQDETFGRAILERTRDAFPREIPLLAKIGILPDVAAYRRFLEWSAPYLDGVTLVNCVSRRIVNPDGSPAFGETRKVAGVLGWAIKPLCLQHTRMILQARSDTGASHRILVVGGVTTEQDALDYLDAGVDAALMGGAPAFTPDLGVRILKSLESRSSKG